MKRLTRFLTTFTIGLTISGAAAATSPDAYLVNFRDDSNSQSKVLDQELPTAIAIAGVNVEEVVVDTSTAAKWEKSAHDAFDRNIVPIFNQWVGLPGFAVVVDAQSKQILGCVNSQFSANEIAEELKKMAARRTGQGFLSKASVSSKTTQCPPAFNKDPA